MKFSVAKEHRDYFEKHGWIEFSSIFTPTQMTRLKEMVDQTLAARLKKRKEDLQKASPEVVFTEGRDLWRAAPELQELIAQPRLGQLIYELFGKKPIRLGYDQLLPPPALISDMQIGARTSYTQFIQKTMTLEETCCLSSLLCGMLIGLTPSSEPVEAETVKSVDVLPHAFGNVTFFRPNTPIDLKKLMEYPGQQFYLVVYTQSASYIQFLPQDPHAQTFKQYGYVYNDHLSDKLNPIIYR